MNSSDKMTATEYQEYIQTGRMPVRAAQQQQAKKSKYHNKRTEMDGKMYASKHEANRAAELKLLARAKEVARVFEQVAFYLPGGIDYIADFVVLWADGHWTVEDAKGMLTDVYKIKKKLMRAEYGIEIVEV